MLTGEEIRGFKEHGFLVVENALAESDLDPVIHEYEDYIDRRARELQAEGKLKDIHEDESFERRLAIICRENNEIYLELDIICLRDRVSFDFLHNDHLMDIVESIIGPEIICSPIQHIRAKLPVGLSPGGTDPHVAPWHQDAGVTWEEADPFFILTVWIPVVEATPENGCLQIIPRTHGVGLLQHESRVREGTVILEDAMPQEEHLTLPMQKGSVLLLYKEIPHRSTPNRSEGVRWSMDLRYQRTGTATGRPFFSDFVTRSRSQPNSVLTDQGEWCRLWTDALAEAKRQGVSAHRGKLVH